MIAKKYADVTVENTIKLLVRCKKQIQQRRLAFATLKDITELESLVADIKLKIDGVITESPREETLNELRTQAIDILPQLTDSILTSIIDLRDNYKLFKVVAALTSKGNHVVNVMAYKRRDAVKYVHREYDTVRRLVQVVDLDLPLLKKY
mmetsp:Transcript_5736/g.9838  ORF Transcript_5736/g.9838 Transcript_5736/m.9838 type:complete len:150 (-) Transcript_5736:13-462(-)